MALGRFEKGVSKTKSLGLMPAYFLAVMSSHPAPLEPKLPAQKHQGHSSNHADYPPPLSLPHHAVKVDHEVRCVNTVVISRPLLALLKVANQPGVLALVQRLARLTGVHLQAPVQYSTCTSMGQWWWDAWRSVQPGLDKLHLVNTCGTQWPPFWRMRAGTLKLGSA